MKNIHITKVNSIQQNKTTRAPHQIDMAKLMLQLAQQHSIELIGRVDLMRKTTLLQQPVEHLRHIRTPIVYSQLERAEMEDRKYKVTVCFGVCMLNSDSILKILFKKINKKTKGHIYLTQEE